MIADVSIKIVGPWGNDLVLSDPQCEDCQRSIVMRFGDGRAAPQLCPSCEDDWKRLLDAGKVFEETKEAPVEGSDL